MPAYHDLDQRWLLLVSPDTVVVNVRQRRSEAIAELRALPPGMPVALAGGRRLGWLAWRGRMRVDKRYVALPSLDTPVAITQVGNVNSRTSSRAAERSSRLISDSSFPCRCSTRDRRWTRAPCSA